MKTKKVSHWIYKGQIFEEAKPEYYGFIYLITNKINQKFYIGKKKLTQTRTKKVKSAYSGKLLNKKVTTDSDWKTYTGSNKLLNADIEKHGIENFEFKILTFAYTQGQLNYLEENAQHKFDALTDIRYYNDAIGNANFRNIKIDGNLNDSLQILKESMYESSKHIIHTGGSTRTEHSSQS